MKKTKPSPKSHLKANQIKRKTAWKRSPICEGVRPFLASLIICSSTSSLDNFSQLGTERRYGRDDWEIPFLRERKETGKDQEEVGNEPKFSTTCLSSSPGYSRGGSPPPEKSGKQRHFSGSCGLNTDPDSSRSYPTASWQSHARRPRQKTLTLHCACDPWRKNVWRGLHADLTRDRTSGERRSCADLSVAKKSSLGAATLWPALDRRLTCRFFFFVGILRCDVCFEIVPFDGLLCK